jgi:DNA-binding response OmpR family regulator
VADIRPILLIVEDDPDISEMLEDYFSDERYHVLTAEEGEIAVEICRSDRPDLILLDIRLPDIDGYAVAEKLRTNQRTREIPIIFLTEKRTKPDRLQGLELGADDYLTKPFDIQELGLRVRNALRRTHQGALTNPVTRLPNGVLVDERLMACLQDEGWVLLRISLQNLDHFREAYGFVASDDVLRAVGLMIQNAITETGGSDDFVGHLDAFNFVILTDPGLVDRLQERILSRVEQSIDYFYPIDKRGQAEGGEKRIKINFGFVYANQGPFAGLSGIKEALWR